MLLSHAGLLVSVFRLPGTDGGEFDDSDSELVGSTVVPVAGILDPIFYTNPSCALHEQAGIDVLNMPSQATLKITVELNPESSLSD